MSRHLSHFLPAAMLLLIFHGLSAQQIFPVSVSGNLIPPHSLVLSDYATTRTQDLSFMLTLNDPVEATRLVKFRLSVWQDGNEILYTNPNYNPPPVLLEKQVPYIIDGADLAGYLNPANLLHTGGGQPGALLPAGFNSFCLEVIDVQRNVPISDRFCASGFFELAQPPLLDLPLCNTLLPYSPTQNLTFSWTPMHLLSLNQPVDVQYEFTLVKMLPGIQDPNDGFNFSTPILQRTVSQNVLQYLEDDPVLEQNGLYAWRVRAIDGRGYDLFQNHGYSQVCTFAFQGGGQLGSPLFSCEGGDCQWNGVLATNPLTATLSAGDEVGVGFFNMRLTQVLPNGQGGYSGAGTIYIPFLYSKLQVAFDNIQVNQAGRMYAGEIRSVAENPDLIPSFFSVYNPSALAGAAAQAVSDFSDQTAQALESYFASNDPANPPNLVSLLQNSVEANALPVGLPIGLDQAIPGTASRLTVAVTGIRFDAHSAFLNAVLGTRFGAEGPWVKFGVKGLCLQPYGLSASAPTLSLLTDVDLSGTVLPIKILGMSAAGEPGTYASWNCEGFDQFVLKGSYPFSRDQVRPVADPTGTLVATFTATTRRLDDILVKMDALDDFYVPGAENFPFHIGETWLDLSTSHNPDGLEFPEGYPPASANNTFRGLYLGQAAVTLPPVFQHSTSGALPKLTGNDLLLDQNGLSGLIVGEHLIDLSTGNLGGWGYSLDSSWLRLVANHFVNSGFAGKMRLPIMRADESLRYTGVFAPAAEANGDMDFTFQAAPDVVTIDLLKSRIQFDTGSVITVGRLNGVFQSPKADLSGLLTAAVASGDPGFAGHVLQEIQNLQQMLTAAGLGALVPNLNMDGIRFNGLKIDLAAADKFQIESIVPQNASLQFLGFNADLSTIDFTQLDATQLATMGITAGQNVLSRGLQFRVEIARDLLGILAPTATFTVIINESPNGSGGTKYEFGGFDLQFEGPDVHFDCAANLDPLPAPGNPAAGPIQGQFAQLQTGYFTLTPDFPLSADNGAGTISGTGKIDVDVLGPFRTLNVTFAGVQVDQSGRIIAGEVVTGGDSGLFNSPNLSGVLSNVQSQVDAMVGGMNSFNLPVVLGVEANGENTRDQGLIIMGLVFKPTEAKAQAKVVFPAGNGQFAEFVIEGLTLVPNGVANFDLAVGLAHDFDFQPVSSLQLLTFEQYNSADNTGSFIRMDCNGFLEFNLAGHYAFPESQLVSLDHPGDPVVAHFNVHSEKWGDFMGQMDSLGSFEIAGMPDFAFHVSDAYLDFSQIHNPPGIVFPEGYNSGGTTAAPFNWRGFFIRQIGLTLPGMFALSGGTPPSFTGENLVIDAQGASTTLIGRNLVDGNIDGWGFALDSLGLTIVANELEAGGLSGHLEMPLVDDPLPYTGTLARDAQGFFSLTLSPTVTTQLNIPALKSHITLNDSTVVTLTTVPDPKPGKPNNRKFKPYADLYGSVGLNVTNADFHDANLTGSLVQQAIALVESVLGPLTFTPPAIHFQGLKINHPALPPPRSYGLDGYSIDGGIAIGGYELGLNQLNMVESDTMHFNGVAAPAVGLRFSIGIPLIGIDVEFWAKERIENGKKKYSFGKINLETHVPTFRCDSICASAPANQSVVSNNPPVGSIIKSGGFNVQVTGPGTGKVLVGFLNSTLDVTFDNIGLNASGELVSGELLTAKDQSMFSPEQFTLGSGQMQFPILSQLGNGLSAFTKLPFSLKQQIQNIAGEGVDLPFDFVVVGLRFTPTGTRLDAALMFETGDADQPYLKFGATGLCFTPQGVNLDQIKLYLAEAVTLGDWGMPITILPGGTQGNTGSYALFSCSGIDEFNLQAKYTFDNSVIKPVQAGKTAVDAYFNIHTQHWGQFIATATIDSFSVAGLDDVLFKITDATIDYDDTQNPPFPAGMPGQFPPTWRGFYLKQLQVALPEAFANSNGHRIILEGNNFIYHHGEGLTGQVLGMNLLSLSTGRLNSWAFSLDTVELRILHNSAESFGMAGKIHIPVTAQDKPITYQAHLGHDTNNNPTMLFALYVAGTYRVPYLGDSTAMVLEASSVAGVKTVMQNNKRKFEPYCDLTGAFNIGIPEGTVAGISYPEFRMQLLGFQNFTLNDATSLIPAANGGLNKMNFKAFSFAGLNYDVAQGSGNGGNSGSGNNGNNNSGSGAGNNNGASNPVVAKFPINIKNIGFGDYVSNGITLKRISFTVDLNFTSVGGAGIKASTSLGILGALNISALPSAPWNAFQFKGVELDQITIDANIGSVALQGGLRFIRNDAIYGNGFKGGITMTLKPTLVVSVIAQFGSTAYGNGNGGTYRYWFADAKAIFTPGIGYAGVGLYGIGGGAYYNMTQLLNGQPLTGATNKVALEVPETGPAPATPQQVANTSGIFEPGVSLSGVVYRPIPGNNLGIKASIVLGSHPNPSAFNADLTLEASINMSTLGLNYLSFGGQAYLMAPITSRSQAKAWAVFNSTLDPTNGTFTANLEAYINIQGQIVGAYAAGPQYKAGAAHFYSEFGPNAVAGKSWYLTIGTPANKVRVKVTPLSATYGGYLMAGYLGHPNIINETKMPPLSSYFNGRLTELTDMRHRNDQAINLGSGIAFGADFTTPSVEKKVLIFYAKYQAGLAFDVTMTRPPGTCNSNGSPVGINGWYLQGQVLAFFDAGIGLQVNINLLFKRIRGRFSIADLHIEAGIQAQLPNPSWFAGQLAGRYRILGGLVKGRFKFKVETGTYCALANSLNDPLADIELVADMRPTEGQTGVAVYTKEALAVVFNLPINAPFTMETDDGKVTYRPVIVSAGVYKGSYGVAGNFIYSTDGTYRNTMNTVGYLDTFNELKFNPSSILMDNSAYTAKITVAFDKRNGSSWSRVNKSAKEYTRSFTTGTRPTTIIADILEYHAPGYRQRNWYTGYASPQIEFTKKGFGYFFNPKISTTIGGSQQCIEHNFYYRLTNLATGESKLLPLSALPPPEYETAFGAFWQNFMNNFMASLAHLFHVTPPPPACIQPTLAQTISNIKNIPSRSGVEIGMASLSNETLSKNAIYELQVVAIPITANLTIGSNISFDSSQLVNVNMGDENEVVQQVRQAHGDLLIGGSPVKILYSYNFKTSQYNNLKEKVLALTNDGRQDVGDNVFMAKFKGEEVFDKFDQDRLTRNAGNMAAPSSYLSAYSAMFPQDWIDAARAKLFLGITLPVNPWYTVNGVQSSYSSSQLKHALLPPSLVKNVYQFYFNPDAEQELTQTEINSGIPAPTEEHHFGICYLYDKEAIRQMRIIKSIVNDRYLDTKKYTWHSASARAQFYALGNVLEYPSSYHNFNSVLPNVLQYFIKSAPNNGWENAGNYSHLPRDVSSLVTNSAFNDYVLFRGNATFTRKVFLIVPYDKLTAFSLTGGLKKVSQYSGNFNLTLFDKTTWLRMDEATTSGGYTLPTSTQ